MRGDARRPGGGVGPEGGPAVRSRGPLRARGRLATRSGPTTYSDSTGERVGTWSGGFFGMPYEQALPEAVHAYYDR
jgi:hypothetical protein